MRVNVVVTDVAIDPFANVIRKLSNLMERHFGRVKENAILKT
jgi:hypothetical protein